MRLKLDENLGSRGAALLRAAGHDVATVQEEALTHASDLDLIEACKCEARALVSLDLDFGNPLRFDPRAYRGIAVLRLPRKPTPQHLLDAVRTLIDALGRVPLDGKLWIVERGRIREHQSGREA